MANSESNSGNTNMIENEITHETPSLKLSIKFTQAKKRPDVNSIFEYLRKNCII